MVDLDKCKFRFSNVSEIDKRRLSQLLEGNEFSFEEPSRSEDVHNELMTSSIIVSIGLVTVVANYFFGKKRQRMIIIDSEATNPDGTIRRTRIEIHEASTEPVENQIWSQLIE